MVELTQKTLCTLVRLPKYRGHLMNWYRHAHARTEAAVFHFFS